MAGSLEMRLKKNSTVIEKGRNLQSTLMEVVVFSHQSPVISL